jgi:hypothetical protein
LIKRHYNTKNKKYNGSVEELNVKPEKVTEITFRIKERKEWKQNQEERIIVSENKITCEGKGKYVKA